MEWRSTAMFFALLVLTLPAAQAQTQQTVDGLTVNIGIIAAAWAMQFPDERAAHPKLGEHGYDHHLVVSLTDAKKGTPVTGAGIRVDVRDPSGYLRAITLTAHTTSGAPDYSTVLDMHKQGRYQITVYIKTDAHPEPLVTTFEWTNAD